MELIFRVPNPNNTAITIQQTQCTATMTRNLEIGIFRGDWSFPRVEWSWLGKINQIELSWITLKDFMKKFA
ncbi:hypothetical protein PV325_012590 [Microctonus aethiopoides]|nr:hypothetical protein PV325_012590 [Microctonus aethiopoides]